MFDGNNHSLLYKMGFTSDKNTYYIKRDDLLPFSFGGNKLRIAKAYFSDMEKNQYDCIISYGSKRSNLNRIIANMSAAKGVPCYIVFAQDESE